MRSKARSTLLRTAYSASLLLGVVVVTFLLFRVVPSNVARIILGPNATPAAVEQLQRDLGMHRPVWIQLSSYLRDVIQLEFGTSAIDGSPVAETVLDKFWITARIGLFGSALALLGSYLLNLAAFFRPRLQALVHVVKAGVAIPSFLTAIFGGIFVGLLFPSVSLSGFGSDASLYALLLPASVVALYPLALLTSVLREQILNARSSDHVAAARASGQSEWQVFHQSLLRPSLVSWLAVLVNQLSIIFLATFVIEVIFTIPGVGTLLVDALQQRDLPMLQGIVIINAAFFVALNWGSELLFEYIDPRVAGTEGTAQSSSQLRITSETYSYLGGLLALAVAVAFLSIQGGQALDPYSTHPALQYAPPSLESFGAIFGRDALGRSVFARTMYATGLSLQVVLMSVGVSFILSLLLGATAGYFHHEWPDAIISWLISLLYTVPPILIVIAVMTVLGSGLTKAFLVIGFVGWAAPARLIRAEVMRLRRSGFVLASRSLGFSDPWILTKEVLLPSFMPGLLALLYYIPELVSLEVGLSFFGIGADPPTPSLGRLIYQGATNVYAGGWWLLIPAMVLLVLMAGIYAAANQLSSGSERMATMHGQ